MHTKHSKAVLFIFLSILSAHQATADIRSVVTKSSHTVLAVGTALSTFVYLQMTNTGRLSLQNARSSQDQLKKGKILVFMGVCGTLVSAYATGYLIKKTYFEKPPVCQTCTSSQSQENHN